MAYTTHGSLAEEVKIHESRVPIPRGMDFPTASAFVVTMAHPIMRSPIAAIWAGETLLVLGASAASAGRGGDWQGARARVIACASTDDKLAVCRQHGADETITTRPKTCANGSRRLRRQGSTSHDAVGGPYTEPALRSTAWRGRLLVVGFAAGEIPKIPLNLTLLKGCAIVGVFWGDYARREPELFARRFQQLARWFQDGALRPHVSETLPLERAAEALKRLESRTVTGKLVLTT